jgi:hypothetical protein
MYHAVRLLNRKHPLSVIRNENEVGLSIKYKTGK